MFKFRLLLFIISSLSIHTEILKAQILKIYSTFSQNSEIILTHHYGNKILKLADIKTADNKAFVDISYNSGICYLFFPDSTQLEFFVSDDFDTLTIDNRYSSNPVIKGSKQAKLYHNLLVYKEIQMDRLKAINNLENNNRNDEIKQVKDLINHLRDSIIKESPGTFLASYMKALIPVKVPMNKINSDLSADSLLKYNLLYYQKHYLDNLNLSDKHLLNTPVYSEKIDYYLEKVIPQKKNSIIKITDVILSEAEESAENYQFLLEYLLYKFKSMSKNAEYEAAFLHLIKNYYFTGKATWISNKQLQLLTDSFNRIKPASLGEIAPNITLKNINNRTKELHKTKGDQIIVYFYNLDCNICMKTTPQLKKISKQYAPLKLEVYSVCVGNSVDEWKDYISRNKLHHWINVFEDHNTNSTSLKYNLQLTPSFFLLDKNFKIVAKNINLRQLEDLLEENYLD